MPDIRQLQGIGDLLAYPAEFEQDYQRKLLNAQLTRAMLSQLGQAAGAGAPAGDPPPFVLTPEQISRAVPDPSAPTTMRGMMGNPVAGTALRGVGALGQVLQIISGSRRGTAAPRPPLAAYGSLLQRQENERWRREQAQQTQTYRQETLEERRQHDRAIEGGKGRGGSLYERDPQAWRRMKEEEAELGAPGQERDLEAAARRKFPNDPDKQFEWKESERARVSGQKTTAAAAAREKTVTTATKTMKEAAPKVLHFIDRVEADLREIDTGPAASRYQEFMAGHVGAPNPAFTRYRTNLGLLQTLLMRMHVGARGGQEMLAHFRNLMDAGTQSSENMRAALEAIRDYATDVAGQPGEAGAAGTGAPTEPAPAEGAPAGPDDLGHGFKLEVH